MLGSGFGAGDRSMTIGSLHRDESGDVVAVAIISVTASEMKRFIFVTSRILDSP